MRDKSYTSYVVSERWQALVTTALPVLLGDGNSIEKHSYTLSSEGHDSTLMGAGQTEAGPLRGHIQLGKGHWAQFQALTS